MSEAGEFRFPALAGGEIALRDFAGRVVLVVNTASKCGFTPQYAALEQLYRDKSPAGLVILGVPCDDFGHQEPEDEAGIGAFCRRNYGVTFPMAAKQHVKGPDAHPFYRHAAERFGWLGRPKWNFHKYLIARSGKLADYFHSFVKPDGTRLRNRIDRELAR